MKTVCSPDIFHNFCDIKDEINNNCISDPIQSHIDDLDIEIKVKTNC